MTDTEVKQSLVDEFLKERLSQYERHFSSPLWKKSMRPYIKALYEIANRKVLQGKDHMEMDIQRGMALAFENILNLPKFIDYLIASKTEVTNQDGEDKLPGAATDYLDDYEI